MNEETNEFLNYNLEDAHNIFKSIINEMKDNGIIVDYNELESDEMNCYLKVSEILLKMHYFVSKSKNLEESNLEIKEIEYKLYLKYISLYVVSLVFIRIFYEIYDTSKLNEMIKYIVGMFLGSSYMFLLNRDIKDNRYNSKEKRELINELKTLKEEYKENHDLAVCEIDGMVKLNDILWDRLDSEKEKIMIRERIKYEN